MPDCAIAPAVARDAGVLADGRARAVGGDQQPRARSRRRRTSATSTLRSPAAVEARRPPPRRSVDAFVLRLLDQRVEQRAVLDHVRERLARLDVAVEGEEGRPHRVLQAAVGDDHVEDRLRVVGDLVPDADGLEQPPRRRHDGGRARIGGRTAERRIGDRRRRTSGPSPWRSAIASARPAKPAPPISTSIRSRT